MEEMELQQLRMVYHKIREWFNPNFKETNSLRTSNFLVIKDNNNKINYHKSKKKLIQ
jgi:hypothetical protein